MGYVRTVEERNKLFWDKVEIINGCWLWMASRRSPKGYGQVVRYGKPQSAHRVSWELANGPIPKGLCVLHKCDNPPCVNPSHLFLGTPKDNADDSIRKGRRGSLLKTHCSSGHEYNEANTYWYWYHNVWCRQCKTCRRKTPG